MNIKGKFVALDKERKEAVISGDNDVNGAFRLKVKLDGNLLEMATQLLLSGGKVELELDEDCKVLIMRTHSNF